MPSSSAMTSALSPKKLARATGAPASKAGLARISKPKATALSCSAMYGSVPITATSVTIIASA